MRTIVFLLEEPSAKEMIDAIMPKLFPDGSIDKRPAYWPKANSVAFAGRIACDSPAGLPYLRLWAQIGRPPLMWKTFVRPISH